MEMEPLLNTPQMNQIQFEKLKRQLSKLKARAPYYARMMKKNRLDPEKLRGFDEFKDKMDIFTKASWRGLVDECSGELMKARTVGTPVTRRPPHSPGRAVFPHPVPRSDLHSRGPSQLPVTRSSCFSQQ